MNHLIHHLYFVNSDGAFQRFLQWKTKTSLKVRKIVKTQAFYWTVLVCVFLNTIVLAVEYYNHLRGLLIFNVSFQNIYIDDCFSFRLVSEESESRMTSLSFFSLDYAEIVFLTIFFLEMMLKLYGLGIHNYFASSFNCFDCAVSDTLIISLILLNAIFT